MADATLIALRLAEAYRDAELRILQRITAAIDAGLDTPDFQTYLLGRLQRLREEAAAELGAAHAGLAAQLDEELAAAYSSASAQMVAEVGAVIPAQRVAADQQRAAVRGLIAEIADGVTGADRAVLRQTDDILRAVVGRVVTAALTRGETRRSAAQRAVTALFGAGLRTVPDRTGRAWSLPDYVEMAVRTGTAQAIVRGHEDTLDKNGLDLVIVQPGPRACPVCDRWARQVLTRSGVPGVQTLASVTSNTTVTVTVDDTLASARAHGWQHPNCRCSLRAYLPGATRKSAVERPPYDREAYEAQQRQRAIENQIRKAKLAQATAITPEAKTAAAARVRVAQGRMRDHLGEHEYLKRQSEREQITGRFGTPLTGK